MPNINDTYASVLSGYSGSVNDRRSELLTGVLAYAKPLSLNDMEAAALASLGYTGALNDAWDKYIKALGGFGTSEKADYLSSTFYGNPVPFLFASSQPGAWYDPSDITTLFQDNLGATPVTAAGQTVGRILDKSGRGNHATQATLAQRPTYQIDSTGRPYLSFDGVDDGMVTGTITPAIDKVQVFTGIRKLSDATAAAVVEFSATLNTNEGSFYILAPNASASVNALFASKGSLPAFGSGGVASIGAAPSTKVITGIGSISSDTSIMRVNGSQVATSATDQGTGNYLAYPLYIGRRAGTSIPFSGRIYSLIVRFGSNLTTGQITSTEKWVNSKTGAF